MIGAMVVLKEGPRPIGYVVQESGCWEWVGAMKGNGYGSVHANGRVMQAHRFSYELARGPIPAGLDLDHLCRNRRCVRPDHLEPVTRLENLRRGIGNAGKTHCKRGHPFTKANTYIRPLGARLCRACARIADKARQPRAHH